MEKTTQKENLKKKKFKKEENVKRSERKCKTIPAQRAGPRKPSSEGRRRRCEPSQF
jgi:hypothetical protein